MRDAMKLHRVKITNQSDDETMYVTFEQPVSDVPRVSERVVATIGPKQSTTAWCSEVEPVRIEVSG